MSNVIKNTLNLLDHGLIGNFRRDCQANWLQFTQHRFVKELAMGTLKQQEFQQFLIQDYLYLLDYCRVEALAIYKSKTLKEMQYFSSLLQGLINIELPLHMTYCQEWGINQKQLENYPKALELVAYSQYLLSKAAQGDLLDLLVLILPCLVGYSEIALKILIDFEGNIKNNPYQSWINLYTGSGYLEVLKNSLCFLDQIGEQYGAKQRYEILLEEFRTSVQLETFFWNVGNQNSLQILS